jgi:hypothetical protein
VPRGQREGSLRPYFRFSRQHPLLFYQVAPQLYSRGRVGPVRSVGIVRSRTQTRSFFFSLEVRKPSDIRRVQIKNFI